LSHSALAKANLKPPRTFKEAKIADDMARRACGLDDRDNAQQALIIHINELGDGFEPRPIEASAIDAELLSDDTAPIPQEPILSNES
jgi:hypothetical protein